MEQPSRHITRELACPGGNATITSRSDDLWSSSGRSNGAATGAKNNAATVRTTTHSVIVFAQMIARTQLRASSSANWLWRRDAGYRQVTGRHLTQSGLERAHQGDDRDP